MTLPGTAPSAAPTLIPLGGALPKWPEGQVLNAVVESIVGADRVALRIGTARIEAEVSAEILVGQRLSLQVVRNEAQLLLRVLAADSEMTAGPPKGLAADGTVFTLKTALPRDLVQPGARLQAVVTAGDGDDVTLAIGDRRFQASASQAVAPGQRLNLQVVQAGRPAILKVAGPGGEEDTLPRAMREALPRQLPLQQVFARLTAFPPMPGGTAAALLKHLLQNLPAIERLTDGNNFRSAVQNAGQFLERRLADAAPAAEIRQDLKANLLRLLAALGQTPEPAADLSRQIEAALARVQLHQLSAAAPDANAPAWAGEIPLRHGDAVDVCRLRIDRDGGQDAERAASGWSAWITLDLRTLGPLHVRLTLGGGRLSTTVWAEAEATAALVSEHLDTLRQSLRDAGLDVAALQCHRGRPRLLPADRLPTGLLDILV